MKLLLAIALAATVAGCGSTSTDPTTVTETSPPKTVTQTNDAQVSACQIALQDVIHASGQLLSATTLYEKQIVPAYKAGVLGSSLNNITANIRKGTDHVHRGTTFLNKAQSFAKQCVK
jgi:hypothetical protein